MRRTRLAYLTFGAVWLTAYPAVSTGWQDVLFVAAAVGAVLAIILGIRFHRPPSATPWLLLASGLTLSVLGRLMATIDQSPQGEPLPYPSLADIPALLFHLMLLVALAQFLGRTRHDRAPWIDATIWTIGLTVLAWEPLLEGRVLDNGSGVAARIVAIAYTLLDLGLLLLVLRMIAGRLALTPAFLLLSAGMFSQAVTDLSSSAQVLDGTSVDGLSVGWLITSVAIGAAALHPSMAALTEPTQRLDAVASRWRLGSLGLAAMATPALLALQVVSGDITGHTYDVLAVAVAISIIFWLAVARGNGLIALAEGHVTHLSTQKDQLERVMLDRERIIDELNTRVRSDTLTGLASRDRFVETLEAALAAGGAPSVAFLDLDDFKTINDTLGHAAGDSLLRDVASRLRGAVQPSDVVARFGGDEFAVLFDSDVELCAQRLLSALQPPAMLQGRELQLSVSIGVTTAKARESVAGDLLREADVAMYTAKRAGGGWARYATGMSALLLDRMNLRALIVDALRDGEIVPWFQPMVDLATGRLLGFEALARWCRSDQPVRDPGTWLPLAEETGLIVLLDRSIFRAAVAQFVQWRSQDDAEDLQLAVNLSGRTLQQSGIAEEMIEVLAQLGLPPDRLTVEVTEGVLIEDERVSARLQILRSAGVKVALDDFGTGWSSLSYLRRFPVDVLKLDRTFTAELVSVSGGDAIPAAVTQLARTLGLELIAEGVETWQQRARLLELGFGAGQGYLFGSAQPAPLQDATHQQAIHALASTERLQLRVPLTVRADTRWSLAAVSGTSHPAAVAVPGGPACAGMGEPPRRVMRSVGDESDGQPLIRVPGDEQDRFLDRLVEL